MTAQIPKQQVTATPKSPDFRDGSTGAAKLTSRIFLATFVGLGLLSVWYTVLAIHFDQWQLWTIMALAWLAFAMVGSTFTELIKSTNLRAAIIQGIVSVVLIVVSGLVENSGLYIGPFIIAFSILIASTAYSESLSGRAITIGIGLAVIGSLANVFAVVAQVQSPETQISLGVILAVLLFSFGYLIFRRIIPLSMRTKLVTAGLVIGLIPIFVVSLFQVSFMSNSISNTTNQFLQYAAVQVANKVDDYFNTNSSLISRDSTLTSLAAYLILPPGSRSGSPEEANLRNDFLQLRTQINLDSYAVLDSTGYNVYDTNPTGVGRFETFNDYFQVPMATGTLFVSDVIFDPTTNGKYIYFSRPILQGYQKIVGVLRARYNVQELQREVSIEAGLIGLNSYPIVLDENLVRMADSLTPNNLYKSVVPLSDKVIQQLQDAKRLPLVAVDQLSTNWSDLGQNLNNPNSPAFFSTTIPLANPIQVSAATAKMKTKPWTVLYVQNESVLADLQNQQNRLTILIATIIGGLIGVVATFGTRLITRPIINLTENAEKITAGDLNIIVPIFDRDEIGKLADGFNVMTTRLRTLINELEERVRARTFELEIQNKSLRNRTQQIQTISEVARNIASAQDLEKLLSQVAQLVSDRFGFYHVGIFLVDEAKEYAELRATNSEGGKRMLARQHKLRVGQVGIVGYVTSTGKPRIALDVGEDSAHFKNPDLPLTRSEMALPLMGGGAVIGALDVQSERTNAFSQEDIELFSTLADQVAIAIINSRLYQETVQALEDSQQIHRQYLRQEWAKLTSELPIIGYDYTPKGMIPIYTGSVNDQDETLQPGKVIAVNLVENDKQVSILKVPITLRGEVIGTIDLKDESGEEWDEGSIATAEAVADQISQALENARLFEQTQRRADRERKVLEITSRIRSTTDPEAMIKIATAELQNALNARAKIINPPIDELNDELRKGGNGFHPDLEMPESGNPD